MCNVDILFPGCQGFFLRHNASGKCISAEDLFWDGHTSARYWAEMVDDCLYKNASFRYLPSKIVHNIATGGSLVISDLRRYKRRLFIFDGKNMIGKKFENSNMHRLKQTNAGSLFFYDRNMNSCFQPDAKIRYIDQKKNECISTAEQRFTFGKKNIHIHVVW